MKSKVSFYPTNPTPRQQLPLVYNLFNAFTDIHENIQIHRFFSPFISHKWSHSVCTFLDLAFYSLTMHFRDHPTQTYRSNSLFLTVT